MDIGTAKPTPRRARASPHHLIDIVDPTEAYSAARFARDAHRGDRRDPRARPRADPRRRHDAVLQGADRGAVGAAARPMPRVRARLDARAAREGWPALHAELARVDPATAARLAADRRAAHPARARGVRDHRPAAVGVAGAPRAPARARRRDRASRSFPRDRARAARRDRAALRRDARGGPRRRARARCASAIALDAAHAVDALRRLPAGVGSSWTARSMPRALRAQRHRRDAPARQAPAHVAARDAGRRRSTRRADSTRRVVPAARAPSPDRRRCCRAIIAFSCRPESAARPRPCARTLYDKLWDSHVVREEADGTALLYIDRHLVHEVTSPQAYEGLQARRPQAVARGVDRRDRRPQHADQGLGRRASAIRSRARRSRRSTPTSASTARRRTSRSSTAARASCT